MSGAVCAPILSRAKYSPSIDGEFLNSRVTLLPRCTLRLCRLTASRSDSASSSE